MYATIGFGGAMETKFLTPIQLWQDFNPVKDLLETAVKDYIKIDDDIAYKSLYFTALGSGDDSVRAYAEIFIPSSASKKAVIFLNDIDEGICRETLVKYAKEGFISASVDLCGEDKGGDFTKYKGAYAYGRYSKAKTELNNCYPSAEACPVVLWTKIVRRFLTVLMDNYPKAAPVCVAEKSAGDIAWHLAAMDTRIIGAVTVLGNKFGNLVGWQKPLREESDENTAKWDAAVSASAYAKFVGCPLLVVTASNSNNGEFDMLEDIQELLPENNPRNALICPRLTDQITEDAYNTVIRSVASLYGSKWPLPPSPILNYDTQNDLVFRLKPDESERKLTGCTLYYSFNEQDARYRNWHSATMQKEGEEYIFTTELCDEDKCIYAFAEIKYRDLQINSAPVFLQLEKTDYTRTRFAKMKLLYDTGMENCFFAETDGVVLPKDVLEIRKSEIGISGISVRKGILSSFMVGEKRRIKYEGALQISAFGNDSREITVRLIKTKDGKSLVFSATHTLSGNTWEKLTFEPDDFRTEEGFPMEDWTDVKKIEFVNAEGVLFINMLWV
jgi:hypothetical protein